jgi:hypothetical protein
LSGSVETYQPTGNNCYDKPKLDLNSVYLRAFDSMTKENIRLSCLNMFQQISFLYLGSTGNVDIFITTGNSYDYIFCQFDCYDKP